MPKLLSAERQGGSRFSVIIPTYQRRELVVAAVESLARQESSGAFEVIVVVDGSTDGSAEALRGLATPFPLTVLEHPNRGLAATRNRGAAAARGEILLFLDDDMEADPRLLTEHDRSHRSGADVVLGHIPLHPDSPSNILSIGVKEWADNRLRELSSPDTALTLHDLIGGQMSLPRTVFKRVCGFDDVNFTRGGSFGDEDLDFGCRLLAEGYRVVFNPNAISWQSYVVGPRQHLSQWRQAGRADVAFARKHPELADEIFAARRPMARLNRWVWRRVAAVPLLTGPLRWLATTLVERGAQDRFTTRLFFEVRAAEYWRGVHEAGGMPRTDAVLRVLAYHSIADLAGAPVCEPYGVPPGVFRRQLDLLRRLGFRFVSAEEFLHFLHGHSGLPRRAVLLTFDDCYQDLLHVALPLLEEQGIPAVAFAVSGRLGQTNSWDGPIGAPQLRLLNGDDLRHLAQRGIEIGAHSRTHPFLTRTAGEELPREIAGSLTDLEAIGLKRPRLFAYPHGETDPRVQRAVQAAGLEAAFTVEPGFVRFGQDLYRIPRTEIMRDDVGWKFLLKVISGGRSVIFFNRFRSVGHRLWRGHGHAVRSIARRGLSSEAHQLADEHEPWTAE